MKVLIGLLVFVCAAAITVYLATTRKIDSKLTIILLSFAVVSGFVVANYDMIKRLKAGGEGLEIEMAKREIGEAKSKALTEIEKEVEGHKESITMLIRTGNELSGRLEKQKSIVNGMIKKAQSLEMQLQADQKTFEDLKGEVVLAHRNAQAIFSATKELSLILTRITYVQGQTKNELGSSVRLKKAAEIIEKDINRVLNLMISDPKERSAFVAELTNALPSRGGKAKPN